MRKIFTLLALTAIANFANSQTRVGQKLYWNPNATSASYTITAASGVSSGTNYRFTDSTQWYTKSGAVYTRLSAQAVAANRNILTTDTLVINGHRLDINTSMVIPAKVNRIILGTPQTGTGTQTLALQSGITFTLASTTGAMSVNSNGVLRLRQATVAAPTKLVMGTVTKAIVTGTTAASNLVQTGAQLSGVATLGVTAYAASAATATGGTFGGFSQLGTLPIVLMAFDAVKQTTGVSIRWTTQQEFNTDVFFVERSNNGVDYVKVGTVAAAGNSTVSSSYNFTDASPVTGIVYYRVRVIDLDGKQGLTSVKALRASTSSVKVGIYPNPATSYANVIVNADSNNPFTVAVYNQQGMLVGTQAPGMGNAIRLDLSRYASGQYTVNVRFADGSMQSEKILVAKN